MQYNTFKIGNKSLPGTLYKGYVLDLLMICRQLNLHPPNIPLTLLDYLEYGVPTWTQIEGWVNSLELEEDKLSSLEWAYHLSEVTILAPVPNSRKLILLAGNYRAHIREVGYRVPEDPIAITPQFFLKPPSTTLIGDEAPIKLSENAIWVDWEVELAVIIGKKGKFIPESTAMDYVFGYSILNDISERNFNSKINNRFLREKDPFLDWLHGKWFDGFAPMGPTVVTKDEIYDPHQLEIKLWVNDQLKQSGNTSQMIHNIPFLINKLSEIITLEPGDIISTGTPSGVGQGSGERLNRGDIVKCEITGLGVLKNAIV